VITSRDSKAV